MKKDNFFEAVDNPSKANTIEQQISRDNKNSSKEKKLKKPLPLWLWIALLVIGLILLFVFGVAVKAGVIRVPVLSSLLYKSPQPSRDVILKDSGFYRTNPVAMNFDEANKQMVIELTEDQATNQIRTSMLQSADPAFGQNIQVVFDDGQIEVFGNMLHPVQTELLVRAEIIFKDHLLDYRIVSLRIGGLAVDPRLADWAIKKYLWASAKSKGVDFGNININPDEAKIRLDSFIIDEGLLVARLYFDAEGIQEVLEKLAPVLRQQLKNDLNR